MRQSSIGTFTVGGLVAVAFLVGSSRADSPTTPTAEIPTAPKAPLLAPPKRKVVLRGVNFEAGQANLGASARLVLDETIFVMKEQTGITVVVVGHTDSQGRAAYNQQLSVRRAEAVKEYLVSGGIEPSRVRVEGKGESQPVAGSDEEDGRAQNRRVEIKVTER